MGGKLQLIFVVYTLTVTVLLFLLTRSPSQIHHSQPPTTDDVDLTNKIVQLFPEIDVDPTDQFVSLHELTQWNLQQAHKHELLRSKNEMIIYDKNHDGFVSFSEFGLSTSDGEGDPFGYDMKLLEKEQFFASDSDGDGVLNLAEFNDFLHPADSKNPKVQRWLCKAEVWESDTDRDGKVSFKEFYYKLFDSVRYDDEKSYNNLHHSDDSRDAAARVLFSQLDKDHDGYLSDSELLPIIGKLRPSGHYYAKKQAEFFISQAEVDKDGRLSLAEMIENNAFMLFDAIFYDHGDEYVYSHDEFF